MTEALEALLDLRVLEVTYCMVFIELLVEMMEDGATKNRSVIVRLWCVAHVFVGYLFLCCDVHCI